MQGAAPLASPGAEPGRHWSRGRTTHPAGGGAFLVACRPCRSGIRRGGLPSLSPARPAFSSISFPYPPDPLPPRGRGRILVFLCKGLRPLHPPGLNPGGTGAGGEPRTRRGAALSLLLADLAVPESAGAACLPCRRLVLPLALFLSPIPPTPFPRGEGGDY